MGCYLTRLSHSWAALVFKHEMKEEARRIAVSLFSCCPRSEVKPCPLWVLMHAAVDALQNNPVQDIRPSVAWSAFLLSFMEKIEKRREQEKLLDTEHCWHMRLS